MIGILVLAAVGLVYGALYAIHCIRIKNTAACIGAILMSVFPAVLSVLVYLNHG